jgi:hypothetical protein
MVVKRTQRQGMRGPGPLMVWCGAPPYLAVSGPRGKSAVWLWLTGRCGATFGLWLAGPAEGCLGRRRGFGTGRRRRLAQRMVGRRAAWVGQVVTVEMSGSGAVKRWGRCGMCTDVAAKWRVGAVLEHRRCRRGDVRMEGVVMGCREPEPRGSGAVAGVGAGWFGAHRLCRRAFRGGQVCWCWAGGRRRCHGVVTSGAKHGGTQGDTLRRFVPVGGRGGTGWDG